MKKRKIFREGFSDTKSLPYIFSKNYLTVWIICSFSIGAILLGQTFYITIIKASKFNKAYEAVHYKREWILPPRGLILDRNGLVLALNGPGKKENEFSRFYPQGEAFSHLLGFIGRIETHQLIQDPSYLPFDLVGKAGLEAYYERFLRGIYGNIDHPIRIQGNGVKTPLKTPPTPGSNLILTIDSEMQKKLYDILKAKVKDFSSPGGAGVLLDPKSGRVLALVSIPSFNNNELLPSLLTHSLRPFFNRVIAGEYPAGSTIKPFLATAALQEGIVTPDTVILDKGKIETRSIYNPEITWIFRGWKALGPVNIRRAIAMSSNIYFYTVGGGYGDIKGLGIEKMSEYLERFGFKQRAGIDLEGEAKGFIPLPQWKSQVLGEPWFIGDTYNTAIGQGFMRVTPLQLAVATSVIANRGLLYKPYLVERIITLEGKEILSRNPQVLKKDFFEPWTLEVAREGMREAVTDGTVWRLRNLPQAVGAKTGTAQVSRTKPPHAWVTLFAPYKDPDIVLTILIENGEGGEKSAVPAAKEFLQWYFDNKHELRS